MTIRRLFLALVLMMTCFASASAEDLASAQPNAVAPPQTSRSSAVMFSEAYAKSRHPNYPSFPGDCTNYVSQSLGPHGAGYPMTSSWYAKRRYIVGIPAGWEWTKSWSVVVDFLNHASAQGTIKFITFDNPRGKWSSGIRGDILSYQWSGRGAWNHLSFIATTDGTDPDSRWKGTLVNQHTTDRWHAFWTLQPYNPDWQTTRIGRWQVKYTK